MTGSRAGLNKTSATASRPAAKFYREPLGRSWLVGVVVIPLLIAGIGYVMVGCSQDAGVSTGESGMAFLTQWLWCVLGFLAGSVVGWVGVMVSVKRTSAEEVPVDAPDASGKKTR